MSVKKIIAVALIAAAGAASLSALDATLTEVTGKVEIKAPGKDWIPGKTGAVMVKGTMISTGFKSVAVFAIGKTQVTVRPMTRLSIEAIIEKKDSVSAECFLAVGKMKAEVKKPEGGKVDFTVKSPVATASVRGTIFEFDGLNLSVDEGTVVFAVDGALVRSFSAGESTSLSPVGKPLSGKEESDRDATVQDPNSALIPPSVPEFVPPVVEPPKADIVIQIE